MSSEVEIGVWVEGVQKWVSGVTRRTTCHDVIKALLRAQNLPAEDGNGYVIVERWRKVERPLDHEQRILKVWRTWGEAIQEVRFTLRAVREDGERLESEAESRTERSRRRHRWKNGGGQHHSDKPVKKTGVKDDPTIGETMDRLMRLVLAQGETIQTQIKRLQERDQQIESYEQQMHLLRVKSIGSDYLLHSYLREPNTDNHPNPFNRANETKDDLTCEETSNDSGVVTEEIPDPSTTESSKKKIPSEKQSTEVVDEVEEVRLRVAALERLEMVLTNLIEQEMYLTELESTMADIQKTEVVELEEELSHLSKIHSQTVSDARKNDTHIREIDMILCHRRLSLDSLSEEEVKLDEEYIALEEHLNYIIHLPPSAFKDFEETTAKNKSENSSVCSKPSPIIAEESETSSSKTSEIQRRSTNSTKEDQKPVNPINGIIQKDKSNDHSNLTVKKDVQSLETTTTPSALLSSMQCSDKPPPLPSSSPPPLEPERNEDVPLQKTHCVDTSSSSSACSSTSCSSHLSSDASGDLKERTFTKKCLEATKDSDSTDSNSDTGLSSLHSSGDEGVLYSLDTLV